MSIDLKDMARRLQELERDVGDYARQSQVADLELARAIRRSRVHLAEEEHRQAWERLRPSTAVDRWKPRVGHQLDPDLGAGLLDRLRKGDPVADTLGNLDPFSGVGNMLVDPLIEMPGAMSNVTGAEQQVAHGWYTAHVVTSGSVLLNELDDVYPRGSVADNPFNTEISGWECRLAASSEANFYLYAKPGVYPNGWFTTPPYLVGAFRVIGTAASLPANMTRFDVYVELYNVTDGTLLATSSALALGDNFQDEQRRLVVASAANPLSTKTYQLRLRVHAQTGAGGSAGMIVYLGEPQLVWAYTPDAPPFAPQVAHWIPNTVNNPVGASNTPFGTRQQASDTVNRFSVSSTGTLTWSDGTNPADVNLFRAAADLLATNDTFRIRRASNADAAMYFEVAGDTHARFVVFLDGEMEWGPGGGTLRDVSLRRSAAGILLVESPSNPPTLAIAGASAGSEGGELQLLGAPTFANWAIDNFAGRVRMHSAGVAEFDIDSTRLLLDSGRIDLGADVNLYRGAADRLRTDDIIEAGLGSVSFRRNLTDSADRRNWAIITEVHDTGDLAFRESTSNTADPITSSNTRFRLTRGGGMMFGGTSFPTPLTGMLVYRTDHSMWFRYDGTRWSCTCPHELPAQNVGITWPISASTGAGLMYAAIPDRGMDVHIDELVAFFYVTGGTALGPSHKWQITMRIRPAGTDHLDLEIASGASDTYRWIASGGYALDLTGSQVGLDFYFTKTGTPGTLRAAVTVGYRYIAT